MSQQQNSNVVYCPLPTGTGNFLINRAEGWVAFEYREDQPLTLIPIDDYLRSQGYFTPEKKYDRSGCPPIMCMDCNDQIAIGCYDDGMHRCEECGMEYVENNPE